MPGILPRPIALNRSSYTKLDGKLHFLDCGERFLTEDGFAVDASLMPDALHPNAAGYELLAECLDPLVTQLMQRSAQGAQRAGRLVASVSGLAAGGMGEESRSAAVGSA
jgi:hypothetical protein